VNTDKNILYFISLLLAFFLFSGCSALSESLASQTEVPTLENQANRVAIGMTIVRENNIMAFKMPISADAKWPGMVASDINDTTKEFIDKALMRDPYFATKRYTSYIQRRMIGSNQSMNSLGRYANLTAVLLDQSISPLTYRAFYKIIIFYGKKSQNWPDIFNYNNSLSDFLDFKDGNFIDIESPQSDVYQNISEALISLAPINFQKELKESREDMFDAFMEVASNRSKIGRIKESLKSNKDENNIYLSSSKRDELNNELEFLKIKTKNLEEVADNKQEVYFTLLDRASKELQNSMELDDKNYIRLAKNINIVAHEIYSGSSEAYTSFALAMENMITNNIIQNFPNELKSLALGKAYVPYRLQSKYNERIKRVVKNSIYLLPNVFIGTYYASKQLAIAKKYEDFTDIVIEAYDVHNKEQNTQGSI